MDLGEVEDSRQGAQGRRLLFGRPHCRQPGKGLLVNTSHLDFYSLLFLYSSNFEMDSSVSKFPQYRYFDPLSRLERRFKALLGSKAL